MCPILRAELESLQTSARRIGNKSEDSLEPGSPQDARGGIVRGPTSGKHVGRQALERAFTAACQWPCFIQVTRHMCDFTETPAAAILAAHGTLPTFSHGPAAARCRPRGSDAWRADSCF